MAEPRPADRQRNREPDRLALLADQLAEPHGDMHVGRRQHSDLVELPQQPGRAHDPPRLERISQRAHPAPPSSTSLSDSTSEPGGRHANTPASASPAIPRRNRYST